MGDSFRSGNSQPPILELEIENGTRTPGTAQLWRFDCRRAGSFLLFHP